MLDVETLGAALKLVKKGGGGGGEGAAIIDDSKILTSTTWSSQKIVDALCPPFTVSGATVQCTPVANYPLDVQVKITPTQEGTGDPSPENVRPIVGWDAVNIHQSNGDQDNTYTVQLGQTVYGGTVDAVTGVGSEEWEVVEFDGTENWMTWGVDNFTIGLTGFYLYAEIPVVADSADYLACSHLVYNSGSYGGRAVGFRINLKNSIYWVLTVPNEILSNTESSTAAVDSWKSYLAAQAAAGTPVTIAYKLATPTTFQATGAQSIPALPGTNTVYTDAGVVTVSGLSDTVETFNALENRIAALEEAAISG